MKKFELNHLYMHQETGGVIKILAQVDSPSHGDIFIGEHLLSGRLLGFDFDTDCSKDWYDVTNRNKLEAEAEQKYS